jgi:sugar O-acyltransferase (sialic acid O-acetyltransferase NeuD family)
MTMTPIVLIGGGGHAKVVSSLVGKIGKYRIVGYTALAAGSLPPNFAPYLGEDHALPDLVASGRITAAVIGIGIIDVDAGRPALRQRLMALGLALPSIVSPMAVVNTDVVIGDGTVIMDGAVINPGSKIGECSIINTNATVEHDCTIGDCSHIAPGAILCGGVSVDAQSIVGAGACVLPGVRIGSRCIVGAGATVTRDLAEPGVYMGSPATRIAK